MEKCGSIVQKITKESETEAKKMLCFFHNKINAHFKVVAHEKMNVAREKVSDFHYFVPLNFVDNHRFDTKCIVTSFAGTVKTSTGYDNKMRSIGLQITSVTCFNAIILDGA